MKWFRFYNEAMHDPKVQRLRADAFKCWINILCLASDNKVRGVLPSIPDIAFTLRLSEPKAEGYVAELVLAGLLDKTPDGRLRPHNWHERQSKSDNVADRVKRHRMKHSASVRNGTDVTLHETLGNEIRNDAEGDGEGDTELDPPGSPPDGESNPPRKTPGPAANTSAETEDAAERVTELFGGLDGMPQAARSLCRDFKAAWVIEAAISMHGSGKADPRYLRKIVERYRKDGGSDNDRGSKATPSARRPPVKELTPERLAEITSQL